MDDRYNIASPPRQTTVNNKGDYDRVNNRPPQSRRMLYSRAQIAGSGMDSGSVPGAFAEALMEAAAALVPDSDLENSRISLRQLLDQTAVTNLMATAPNNIAALQPAMLGYAAHIANQVQLESNAPVRFKPGDRFGDRDGNDGHVRVPPVNESRDSPEVL